MSRNVRNAPVKCLSMLRLYKKFKSGPVVVFGGVLGWGNVCVVFCSYRNSYHVDKRDAQSSVHVWCDVRLRRLLSCAQFCLVPQKVLVW